MDIKITFDNEWISAKHMRDMQRGEWLPVSNGKGGSLRGVVGKRGVTGPSRDGVMGGDIIKMNPGSAFPLHTHEGEHMLYVLSGNGFVDVDGKKHPVRSYYMIYIHAHYPHGVGVDPSETEPLVFVAVGHPHAQVDSPHRMQLVEPGKD